MTQAQSSAQSSGAAFIEELFVLTDSMVQQIHDADFLLQGVEKRQTIIDAYDEWAKQNPESHVACEKDSNIRQVVDAILSMDRVIVKALEEFKDEVQKDAMASTSQKKVMGYLGNAISSSGSYMDVKLK